MNEASANESSGNEWHVPADDSPVPAGPGTLPFGARPQQEPNRLILRPFLSFGCAFASLLIIMGLGAGGAVLFADKPVPTEMLVFILVPLILFFVFFLYRQTILPRVTFDKEVGQLVLGWNGRRGRRPLSSVIGVQVMQTRKQFGGQELNIPAVAMYQLNLILDDPAERRLNVLTCDPLTARSNAKLVADFLGVPVLDCAPAADGAAAASTPEAGTVESMTEMWTVVSPVVVEPAPDVLVIRPRRLAFLSLYRLMGLVGAVPLLVLAAQGIVVHWSIVALVGASLCFPFLVQGLPLLLNRGVRFDREQALLTLGRRAPVPLASVKAVEVVEGLDYQLILLPSDPLEARLSLISDADAALVRRAAERVASFLGVPLVVTRRQTPKAVPFGADEEVNSLEHLNRSALPPGSASIFGSACVVLKGEEVLVLRPRLRYTWFGSAFTLAAIGLGLYLLWLAWQAPVGLGQAAGWLTLVLFGLLSQFAFLKPLLLYRDRFDRQAGLLTLGWFGLKGIYPLAKILAVQFIPAGLVDNASGRGRERVSYQLNLVMSDVYEDRLNLTNDSDLEWTRQAGQQIANFLGIPAIDQIAESA